MNYRIIFLFLILSSNILCMQPIRHAGKIIGYSKYLYTQECFPPRIFHQLFDANKNCLGILCETPCKTPTASFTLENGFVFSEYVPYLIECWKPKLLKYIIFTTK